MCVEHLSRQQNYGFLAVFGANYCSCATQTLKKATTDMYSGCGIHCGTLCVARNKLGSVRGVYVHTQMMCLADIAVDTKMWPQVFITSTYWPQNWPPCALETFRKHSWTVFEELFFDDFREKYWYFDIVSHLRRYGIPRWEVKIINFEWRTDATLPILPGKLRHAPTLIVERFARNCAAQSRVTLVFVFKIMVFHPPSLFASSVARPTLRGLPANTVSTPDVSCVFVASHNYLWSTMMGSNAVAPRKKCQLGPPKSPRELKTRKREEGSRSLDLLVFRL